MGKARLVQEGRHVTVITYGAMVYVALEAAETLAKENLEVEIIDLRCLLPLDEEMVLTSVRKTNRAILLHEDTRTAGFGAELAARLTEKTFDYLDAPIVRIAAPECPVPFSPPLEKAFLPNAGQVIACARQLATF